MQRRHSFYSLSILRVPGCARRFLAPKQPHQGCVLVSLRGVSTLRPRHDAQITDDPVGWGGLWAVAKPVFDSYVKQTLPCPQFSTHTTVWRTQI